MLLIGYVLREGEYKFGKEAVCPCEPGSRVLLGIVGVEALMHIAGASSGLNEHLCNFLLLAYTGRGQTAHTERDMPDVAMWRVRAANAASIFALEIIGVVPT